MNCLSIEIPGKPVAKQRPRFGKNYVYTPKETVNYESLIKLCFAEKYINMQPLDCPLNVSILAFFPIPKSMKKADKKTAETELFPHTKKPDCDNICKIILDGLNGVAWVDDKLVYNCLIRKYYSPRPRVEVEIGYENYYIQ